MKVTKSMLKRRFAKLYPAPSRLLAIQLDGFTHSIIYDQGKDSSIRRDSFSHCMPEGSWSAKAAIFFHDIGNAGYQNNAQEIIFVLPENR